MAFPKKTTPAVSPTDEATMVSLPGEEGSETVSYPGINRKIVRITLTGDCLLEHRFDSKAKAQMLGKQMQKAQEKTAKDPEACFERSLYHYPGGGYGFPSNAFKLAAVTAAKDADMFKTDCRRWFFVLGYLTKINFESPRPDGKARMQEDVVRIPGTTDIRYRGALDNWSAQIDVEYNASRISLAQLLHIFSLAGFGVGIGEWRPEKDGDYGRFEVAGAKSVTREYIRENPVAAGQQESDLMNAVVDGTVKLKVA